MGDIDDDDSAPEGLTVEECQGRCLEDAKCECVSFQPSNGKCWKRGGPVDPAKFGYDAKYEVYVKCDGPCPGGDETTPEPGNTTDDNSTGEDTTTFMPDNNTT